jgi:hypothetical protein
MGCYILGVWMTDGFILGLAYDSHIVMLVGVWRQKLDKIPRGNMSISDIGIENLRDHTRLDKTVN